MASLMGMLCEGMEGRGGEKRGRKEGQRKGRKGGRERERERWRTKNCTMLHNL